MIEDSNKKDNAFIRQRRNIISISLFIFFYTLLGIHIHEINIFGTKAEIGNPSHIETILWIFWAYFLLRYYQHCPNQEFFIEYRQKLNSYADKAADLKVTSILSDNEKSTEFTKSNIQLSQIGMEDKYRWKYRFSGNVEYDNNSKPYVVGYNDESFEISLADMRFPRFRAFMSVCINTPYFTDYILPYILALTPVCLSVGIKAFE
jgi:hypothetical protein